MAQTPNVRATQFAGCLVINIYDFDDEAAERLYRLVDDVRGQDVVVHFLRPRVLERRAVLALTRLRDALHPWGHTLRVVSPGGQLPVGLPSTAVYRNPAEALEAALSARSPGRAITT